MTNTLFNRHKNARRRRLVFFHKSFAGMCHAGLGVTSGNTGKSLERAGLCEVDVVPVFHGSELKRRVSQLPDTTHVAIHAPWVDGATIEDLVRTYPRIQFTVICHSNVAFLQVDPGAVANCRAHLWLERAVPNFRLSGNSRKFCEAVTAAYGSACEYLPNIYPLLEPMPERPMFQGGTLRIGAFGATRGLKNIMTAAWASIAIARETRCKTEFWVSGGREEGGHGILHAVNCIAKDVRGFRVVQSQWQPWAAFRETVSHMHLLLQPSFTESFNVVTADGCAEGVPSVVSHAIDWVPRDWIVNADDAVAIAKAGVRLLRDRRAPRKGYKALASYNKAGLAAWSRWLAL